MKQAAGNRRFEHIFKWSFSSMSFLRSSLIAKRLGAGNQAGQTARFNSENELPAQILRDRWSIERNALRRLGNPLPEPAFSAITLGVRL
jgi:hypothetical protein